VHWDCLDAWARALPDTTAPAGYNCPICKKMCLFPPKNQVSPIADELRLKMGQVNWARVGLGLPLVSGPSIFIHLNKLNSHPKILDSYIINLISCFQLDNEVPAMKEARLGGVVENLNQDSVSWGDFGIEKSGRALYSCANKCPTRCLLLDCSLSEFGDSRPQV